MAHSARFNWYYQSSTQQKNNNKSDVSKIRILLEQRFHVATEICDNTTALNFNHYNFDHHFNALRQHLQLQLLLLFFINIIIFIINNIIIVMQKKL